MKTTRFAITLAAGAALLAPGMHADRAMAQTVDVSRYPTRPIRLIIPFPPGGSNDILGRFIAQEMTERLGQTTIADNRPGADGIIGRDVVAHGAFGTRTVEQTSAKGHPDNPLNDGELLAKFKANLRYAKVDDGQAGELADAIMNIDSLHDVRPLADAIAGAVCD